jgi:hypothetical protein
MRVAWSARKRKMTRAAGMGLLSARLLLEITGEPKCAIECYVGHRTHEQPCRVRIALGAKHVYARKTPECTKTPPPADWL